MAEPAPDSDRDLLMLTQWLSPAFPLGSFAYSHGLETAISGGRVRDAQGLADWVGTVVETGGGLADAVLLVAAMAPGADLDALQAMAAALAPSDERWRETMDQGDAFSLAQIALTADAAPSLALPLAVGRAARDLSVTPRRVAALYLHAFASNLISGAVRFVPLGQTEGQRVLATLHPAIDRTAARAVSMTPAELTSAAFGADLAAMAHETLDVRIFRT